MEHEGEEKKKKKSKAEKKVGRKVLCTVLNIIIGGINISVLVQTVKEIQFKKCLLKCIFEKP